MPGSAASIALTTTVSPVSILQGEKLFINGTAAGQPHSVAVWILGNNFVIRAEETVNSDSTFSYEITQGVTKTLPSGQYFVVVQHPMQNDVFDIDSPGLGTQTGDVFVYDYVAPGAPISLFKIQGPGSLQGSDAAEALLAGINQSYIDDIGVQTQFQIERSITNSSEGIFRPSTGYWYFDYNLDGIVDKSFRYGGSTDQIIKGDWDGDGKDGIAIFRPSTGYWYFDNTLDGIVDKSFRYGGSTDQIIAGDWQSTGKDGIAIFRSSTGYWYFDYNCDGIVDKSFRYGGSTDRIIVGKWA